MACYCQAREYYRMKEFSMSWASSAKRSKQRKFQHNAPLHIKINFLHANLSKDLRKKYGRRSMRLRSGDTVKIMRGSFRNKQGKVELVLTKRTRVYVTGVDRIKADGTKAMVSLHPSNLQIVQCDETDKRRGLAKEVAHG